MNSFTALSPTSMHRRTAFGPAMLAIWLATLSAAVALPWFTGFAAQRLMVEILTVFAMAMAWNLLAGYGGLGAWAAEFSEATQRAGVPSPAAVSQ